jgi:hypothetical protein
VTRAATLGSRYEVRSAGMASVIRAGSDSYVAVSPSGETTVVTISGTVDMSAGGAQVTVPAGSSTTVSAPGATPLPVRPRAGACAVPGADASADSGAVAYERIRAGCHNASAAACELREAETQAVAPDITRINTETDRRAYAGRITTEGPLWPQERCAWSPASKDDEAALAKARRRAWHGDAGALAMRGSPRGPPAASGASCKAGRVREPRVPASRYAVRGPCPWDRTRGTSYWLGAATGGG